MEWLDGLTALASVLGSIGDMMVATTIALAVVRTPVPLAKALAAIDVLSGGRLVVGLGPGSYRPDHDAAGVALAFWGFTAVDGALAWVLGLVAPTLAAVIWGPFVSPKARRPLSVPFRVSVEIDLYVLSAVALWFAGAPAAAIVLGVLGIATSALNAATERGSTAPGTGDPDDARLATELGETVRHEQVQSTSASPHPWQRSVQYRSEPACTWLTLCSSDSEPQIAHFHPAVGPPHFGQSISISGLQLTLPDAA